MLFRSWTQVLKLLQASVAFQVRSIPAFPVQLAGVAASVKVIIVVPPEQKLDAVALPVIDVSEEAPHCNCLSGGQVIEGPCVHFTVMVPEALPLHFDTPSVTVTE